jgi:hypothetical protein
MISSATCCAVTDETGHPVRASAFPLARCREKSLLLLMHDFSSAAVLSPPVAVVAHAGK